MQRRNQLRVAAGVATPILALAATYMVACGDATPPNDATRVTDDARVTAFNQVQGVEDSSRDRLFARNTHDWVGKAHNNMMDRFRAELRKSGTMTKDMCAYLMDFVSRDDLSPPGGHPGSARAQREGARAAAARSALCRTTAGGRHVVLQSEDLSTLNLSRGALLIAADVQDAVETASDRYALAVRLNAAFDAAALLEPSERDILAATISVAQHSYEYWEDELPAAQAEFGADYSSCAYQYKTAGYAPDDAMNACLGDGAAYMSAPRTLHDRSGTALTLASFRPRMECSLKAHFKRLAGADAVGAILGAVRGLLGGPGGILVGAGAGAAYASLGSFIKSTWDLYWCAM